LLAITLIVFVAGLPGVVSAMRQWLGYLPGVGMVDRATPVRVLPEAVSSEREGVTVTVKQVTALPDRTVIQYQVSGIPESAYPKHLPGSDPEGFQNSCFDPIFIRLPDGTALTYTGYNAISGNVSVPEYEASFTVKPVPGDINDVTVVMPCIQGTERDAIPGAWEFAIHLVDHLVAMPEQAQLMPVIELPSPTPAQTAAGPEPSTSAPADKTDHDIWLTLEKVIQMPDGDQLYGSLQWGENAPYSALTLDAEKMTDAQGQRVPFWSISPDPSQMPAPGSRMVPLAFKMGGPIQQPGPLTLKVNRLLANLHVEDTHFDLDTSAALDENQQWVLNRDFQVGEYSFRVVSATRLADGYEFSLQTGPDINCVELYIQGTNLGQCGSEVIRLQYDGEVPAGKLTVVISNLDVALSGDWQATWLPPESAPSSK
jgi:hypothetical protein